MKALILSALPVDIKRVYDVYFGAFNNERMAQLMLEILFPGGITEEFRAAHTVNTLAFWNVCSYQYTMKCVDVDTSEIVGMLLADVHLKQRTPEERKNFGVPWLEGKERERAEKVLTPLWEVKEKLWGGRPHIYVHVVAIDPAHQGKHAGIALITWGIEMGEKSGLPIYFESSPTTWRLYERFGFKVLKEKLIHSKEVLGTEEDIEVPLMVRMPSAAGGLSFEEWRESGYPSWEEVSRTKQTSKITNASKTEVITSGKESSKTEQVSSQAKDSLKSKDLSNVLIALTAVSITAAIAGWMRRI